MIWRAGMKAVCIKEGPWLNVDNNHCDPHSQPIKGKLYTVFEPIIVQGEQYLVLEEADRKNSCWLASQFRPAVDNNKGMKLLRGILKTQKSPEDA